MQEKKRLLLTGYGAFHTHNENPSLEVVRYFESNFTDSFRLTTKILPVEFARIEQEIDALYEDSFDLVIHLGLAASRDKVTPELFALNWLYSPDRKDNKGHLQTSGIKLQKDRGELAVKSEFPVEALSDYLERQGVPSKVSAHAGTYICNSTFYYSLLKNPQAEFIHIPADCDVERFSKALSGFLSL